MSEFNFSQGVDYHNAGVDKQLRSIDAGSRQLLSVARRRIGQALDRLDEGDFGQAHAQLTQALQTLTPLVHAQNNISFAAGADLIDCSLLEAGMVLIGHGTIQSIERSEPCDDDCSGHVVIETPGYYLRLSAGTEIYVERDRPEKVVEPDEE